jgi:preprotein translocase SecE subunit
VARDRKRAKQRRVRRGAAADRSGQSPGAEPGQPVRSELPGSLDHASAEVDEFDAALVRGAGGVPAAPESERAEEPDDAEQQAAGDELQLEGATPGRGGDDGTGRGTDGHRERPSGAPLRGGNRVVAFLGASWAELQRVQWPDRRQVTQATAVVLGFVVIAGAYLGLADVVAKEIVEFVL